MTPIELFRKNIYRVRDLGGIHQAVNGLVTPIIDTSDILRAQHVLLVSALDHFIHESARIGLLEIFDGLRTPTEAYSRFRVSVNTLSLPTKSEARAAFETEIRMQHSYLSFQHPEKISEAIRLYSNIRLWNSVGNEIKMDKGLIKDRIMLIIHRRNKIAHEADLDPGFPGARWPIFSNDIVDSIKFIENVCEAIDKNA